MHCPLAGVTVADLTVTLPGPYATSLLQRLGARVIKLEPPGGDLTRATPALHDAINAGKESVEVDLAVPEDAELARAVVARADVVVEGWRPGVAARHGLGPRDVRERHPRVVYCSLSGYGAEGALRERPGHDVNYVAASGMTALLFGDRPAEALPVPLADLAGGTFAALRIVAALLQARATGRGAFVDVSITGAMRDWVDAAGGEEPPTAFLPLLPHYGVFETADGHRLSIGNAHEDHFWSGLCRALGMADRAGLTIGERLVEREALRDLVAGGIRTRTRAELEALLGAEDTCWAFADPPAESGRPGGMLAAPQGGVPSLGEHTAGVRAEVDHTPRHP
jgi:crotonobetainyl-CoA:carnitine CoA-transferase CaiB-like acyl-CoA transferase